MSVDDFLSWCTAAGITRHPSIHIQSTLTEGFGATALAPLESGDILITVPRRAAISISTMDDSARLASAELSHTAHTLAFEACRIASATAAGHDPRGPWLAMWPRTAEGSWGLDDEGWKAFDGDWSRELKRLHAEEVVAARAAHDKLVAALGTAASPPSWHEYSWGMSIVSSRAADLFVSGDRQPVLLPMIDLLNHRSHGQHTCAIGFVAEGSDSFVLRCVRPVEAGEQLTISYGAKENAELLHGYGFACYPNPDDTALLRVPLVTADPMFAMQRAAMLPRGIIDEPGDCLWLPLSWDASGRA